MMTGLSGLVLMDKYPEPEVEKHGENFFVHHLKSDSSSNLISPHTNIVHIRDAIGI